MKIGSLVLGPVQTNVYIIINEKDGHCLILDPSDRADLIIDTVRKHELVPEAILLTHGHYDHITAAGDVKNEFHIPILAAKAEEDLLSDPVKNLSAGGGRPVSMSADQWLEDLDSLSLAGMRFQMLFTPGHTAGGACYYFPDEGVLFAGDTLFRMSVGRTDFPTGDMDTLIASINDKLMVLPDETRVYTGHGSPTTIGFERMHNYFLN